MVSRSCFLYRADDSPRLRFAGRPSLRLRRKEGRGIIKNNVIARHEAMTYGRESLFPRSLLLAPKNRIFINNSPAACLKGSRAVLLRPKQGQKLAVLHVIT